MKPRLLDLDRIKERLSEGQGIDIADAGFLFQRLDAGVAAEEALRQLCEGVQRARAKGRDSYYWPDHVGPDVDEPYWKAKKLLDPEPEPQVFDLAQAAAVSTEPEEER